MNMLSKILAVTIGIILTATLMVPVVDDAIKTNQVEYKNLPNGQPAYLMSPTDTLTMEFTTGSPFLINGSQSEGRDIAVFAADNMYIQFFSGSAACRVGYWDGSNTVLINGATALNLTVTNNTINGTVTKNADVTTLTDVDLGTWTAYASNEGNYTMFTLGADQTYYVNDIDQVYGTGDKTYSTTTYVSFEGKNATLNGEQITPAYTITKVDGYEDLYTISTSAYTIGDNSAAIWLAPKVVYGTEEGNGVPNSLLAIIPLFVIVALLAIVARSMISRND